MKISLVRKNEISRLRSVLVRVLSVLVALLLGAVLIALLGFNPLEVYIGMFSGAIGNTLRLKETVKIAVPLLGAALAIAPAFRMRFWNIGAEGQILAGGIAATYFAIFWADRLPTGLVLLLMFVAAVIAGALWGLIPAACKARWNTNETLLTLMLNYIALGVIKYLQNGPWKSKNSTFPEIGMIDASLRLPKVLGVHIGWIFFLLLSVVMYIYLFKTKRGYELGALGGSQRAAQYAGIDVKKTMISTMLISGGIAGIVGFFQVAGASYTLTESTAGGVGFTAITVAWLANLNPFAMILMSLFLAILQKGASSVQTSFGIASSASEVLTGMILFCMLAGEFFIRYRVVLHKKEESQG